MEEKKKLFWLKVLVIFLAVMFVFALASRAAASLTVPIVSVQSPVSGKIVHTVTAQGSVKAKAQTAVVTESGILVSDVCVRLGENVKEGTLLFSLSMESLEEQIFDLECQIKKLALEEAAQKDSRQKAAEKQQTEEKRAAEDYKNTVSENEKTVESAQKQVDLAVSAEEEQKQKLNNAQTLKEQTAQEWNGAMTAKSQAQKELETANADLYEKEQRLFEAKTAFEEAQRMFDNAEEKEKVQEMLDLCTAAVLSAQSDYEISLQEVNEKQAVYEMYEAIVLEKQSAYQKQEENCEKEQEIYETCQQHTIEQKNVYEETKQTAEHTKKAAERVLEDAQASASADNTEQINEIAMAQYERELEKLNVLKEQKGQIYAQTDGVIESIFVQTGQKTTDTAALVMSDVSSGLSFWAQIDKENEMYAAVGDSAQISGVGKEEQCVISGMEISKDEKSITLFAEISSDVFSAGESAQITITRKSQQYQYVIPISAIRQENNKTYVLVLETQNTTLGEQYAARKVEVAIEDKNNNLAAVSANALSADSLIITDSDRSTANGDIVRLAEE